jgi:hypothetical protein
MANSRIPSGAAVAIIGASLALGALLVERAEAKPASTPPIILAAGPVPPIPHAAIPPALVANPPTITAILPAQPTAVAKHAPPLAPAHPQTRPLIPPATLPGQLGPPPQPREPLPIETELLPLGSPPASTPPKQPAG